MDNKNLPLVLYGAGKKSVKDIEDMRNNGIYPICFCDKDSTKQGNIYMGLPVLNIEQIKEKYGEFDIFVTPQSKEIKREIYEFLWKQGINTRNIINCEEEKYVGCAFLESHMALLQTPALFFCCTSSNVKDATPMITWEDDIENFEIDSAVSQWLDMKHRLIQSIKQGEPSDCDGCRFLTEDWWPLDKKLNVIHFAFEAPCQLSCCYCLNRDDVSEKHDRFMKYFDYNGLIKELEKRNLLNDNSTIIISMGEITINHRKNEIFDAVEKYRLSVFTNAIVFDERMAELTARPGSEQTVSVDAGTRETYKKVKGLDMFDRVWENITRYADRGVKFVLKYIFLPENSNDVDVEGFIQEISKVKNVVKILISSNMLRQAPHTDEQIRLIVKMYKLAKQNNISANFNKTFSTNDMERIWAKCRIHL